MTSQYSYLTDGDITVIRKQSLRDSIIEELRVLKAVHELVGENMKYQVEAEINEAVDELKRVINE